MSVRLHKCNFSCCCNCFPLKKLTYLDVNNMEDNNTKNKCTLKCFQMEHPVLTEEDIETSQLENSAIPFIVTTT